MNSNNITDFLNKGIELNFNDSNVIGMFTGAILVGIALLVLFVWLTLKAQKIAKREGIMLFNVLHIILFGAPVAVIAFETFFQEHFALWCILVAVMWAVPFVINIVRIGKYGILFSILQLVYALLICSVVGTVIVAMLVIALLFFNYTMWASDYFDFFVVDYTTGRTIGLVKTGKGTFVDSDGNCYMSTGIKNEFVDNNGNIYYIGKRK